MGISNRRNGERHTRFAAEFGSHFAIIGITEQVISVTEETESERIATDIIYPITVIAFPVAANEVSTFANSCEVVLSIPRTPETLISRMLIRFSRGNLRNK